ncbi:hypothetical protein C8R44DRAFT_820845 [Mycena epipterygia]|nr:hypothetical protein C8R44DRAFT_820845 [Mycena epipterygia]
MKPLGPLPNLPTKRALLAVSIALCAALLSNRNVLLLIFPKLTIPDARTALVPRFPDVTAILLNWARLPNVVQIVTVLCGEALDGVIKEVIVWNNNYARPLVYNDFANCNCSPDKLRIHNSQENLYFQARFMACTGASTPYCFIQDDDYLVQPEVIRSLRARIHSHDIFVLPPDEVLSSHLLSINSTSTNISFGFTWLGYGALILRSNAESFLHLLERIGASDEETKMADNYYSILKNSFPEIWTAAPISLFGGGDFTVGEEGVARNRRHIAAAAKYLDAIASNQYTNQFSGNTEWPYVSLTSPQPESRLERSPCLGRLCVLESTIQYLPRNLAADNYAMAGEIFSHEAHLSVMFTEQMTSTFVNSPLSHAVDADPNTFFRSTWNAAEGDALVLDVFDGVQQMNWTDVEWSWLVDAETAQVLRAAKCSYSSDKQFWAESSGAVSCTTYSPPDTSSVSPTAVLECRILLEGPLPGNARYFRLELREANFMSPWRIYETWLHGKET